MADKLFVIDTNAAIDFMDGKISSFPAGLRFLSVITEMELLAFPGHTPETEQGVKEFLECFKIVPISDEIKIEAIRIRRYETHRRTY